jgi:hypothetical protein
LFGFDILSWLLIQRIDLIQSLNYEKLTPKIFCKNLDNSYFSLSLKGQVMVGAMENSGYAINGKLWKVKKGYKRRIACI